MKTYFKLILLLSITSPVFAQSGFKTHQLTFERVKTAYDEKWDSLQRELRQTGIKGSFNLYLAAYKSEGKLELWLQSGNEKRYKLFKTYDFCAHSGILGPKIKEGDLQTPEGFYYINVFNPESKFHLSLGVNYPNKIDLLRSGQEKPGGDIYIHGNCVTVGCIPLTDEKIKEIYVLTVEAKNGGQLEIPVHIFPFKMTHKNLKKYLVQFPAQKAFWKNLQPGYAYFERHNVPPNVVLQEDKYLFK
ncbi:MAG: L,D-transpeptidase family protein [Candidatus Pedobacter colombiensis]|uniref:L,D-transpeptidase family protein n=1 Tax=Candidatus Pedobacter colombiensis TaxID=3121371 RepID=A0AAJ6B7K6_9SPHI|nr:L,D-transpeptidase family protein [Pedobacter sp.]WEK19954.1 MAG: L,D-transpeptidase family protein [Pedobacter sp.]